MHRFSAIFTALIFWGLSLVGNASNRINHSPQKVDFKNTSDCGELQFRALKNFDRLESEIYQPCNVFPEKHHISSQGWPGDKEGRTILGLVMEAQATHREPVYLSEMIRMIPQKLNKRGYLGPIQGDTINEQQLSGHGWFLRALCEYYIWKKDAHVKKYILDMVTNLALPTKGYHKNYPVSPAQRRPNVGEMAGTSQNMVNHWLLSSDVGCDFIFLDGVVQAYGLFPSKALKGLTDEMIASFLNINLVDIKAQTHATLTGLRALVRYYEITGNKRLLTEAEKRYQLYRELGMSENYENYNWFGRPEWTEPCAIIDSYMLSVQLWQYTRKPQYLEDAQHIYYNAVCHTQRANGGFGCDNCPGPKDLSLSLKTYEAFWCCTMRGGEGLASAIQYAYFTEKNNVYVPFFRNNEASVTLRGKRFLVSQQTRYPFGTTTSFKITPENGAAKMVLHLFAPGWITAPQVLVNGKKTAFSYFKGFIVIPLTLTGETNVAYSFEMKTQIRAAVNPANAIKGSFAMVYGPLMLGYAGRDEITFDKIPTMERIGETLWKVSDAVHSHEFTPVYHLLDEALKEKDYQKQILFKVAK